MRDMIQSMMDAAPKAEFVPIPRAWLIGLLDAAAHPPGLDVPLTLSEAAAESGYSVDHLSRLLRSNRLPNAGRRYSPRIRRGDLPRRPNLRGPTQISHLGDARQVARDVAGRVQP
jgi:hypothetical protein